MDPNLQQLAQYVSQQLRQGVPEQDLRAAMAHNKWTQDWINAAFNVVRQNPGAYGLVTAQQPFPTSTPRQLPIAQPAYAEAPSEESTKEAEPETPKQKKERKPISKRFWIILASIIVFLGISIGAYFLVKSIGDTQTADTKQAQQEPPAPEKPKDEQRKDDLNTMLSNMADYYVAFRYYPTLTWMRDPNFLSQSKNIDNSAFADPAWTSADPCNAENKAILADKPVPHCYSYQATTQDGAACDNAKVFCTKVKLTITMDDGTPYTVTLHANMQVEN